MKVILLQNVPKIGQHHEVKDVSDGFAINFLLPRGLAKRATFDLISKIEEGKKQREGIGIKNTNEFKKKLNSIKNVHIKLSANANEKGHLFKGIHERDLSKAILKSVGLSLQPENIILEKPIKELGEHEIKIEKFGTSSNLKILVEKEK